MSLKCSDVLKRNGSKIVNKILETTLEIEPITLSVLGGIGSNDSIRTRRKKRMRSGWTKKRVVE